MARKAANRLRAMGRNVEEVDLRNKIAEVERAIDGDDIEEMRQGAAMLRPFTRDFRDLGTEYGKTYGNTSSSQRRR